MQPRLNYWAAATEYKIGLFGEVTAVRLCAALKWTEKNKLLEDAGHMPQCPIAGVANEGGHTSNNLQHPNIAKTYSYNTMLQVQARYVSQQATL